MCRYISTILKNNDGEILLKKSGRFWQVLGGEVEHGESPKEAFIRITGEESGIITDSPEISEILSNNKGKQIHIFRAMVDNEDAKTIEENEEHMKFFEEDELKDLDLHNYTKFVFDRIFGK